MAVGGKQTVRRSRTELLLTVVAAALLVALPGVALNRLLHEIRRQKFADQLSAFSHAFSQYHTKHGRWPAQATEVETVLGPLGWARNSPFGGQYEWHAPHDAPEPAAITLTAFHPHPPLRCTLADLLAVDRELDDGNLATGRFRTGFNGWPVLIVGSGH